MKILGRHLIGELADCDARILNNQELLEQYLKDAVRLSGATIVRSVFHHYSPHGVSGVVVIAESHLSIHTWPEYSYAAVDFFTCGESVDPYKAFTFMKEKLGSRNALIREIKRGMPSPTDQIVNHKPATQQAGAAT